MEKKVKRFLSEEINIINKIKNKNWHILYKRKQSSTILNEPSEFLSLFKKTKSNFFIRRGNDVSKESVKDFSIVKIKDGNYPAIITINGFLTQRNETTDDWNETIFKKFPNQAWYHVSWESQMLSTLFIQVGNILGMPLILSIPLLMKPWHAAMKKAVITGVLLSDVLIHCKKKEFILMGHSLGAKVICSCLTSLAIKKEKIIFDVHLLGGAEDSDIEQWSNLKRSVTNNIYNYYSKKDRILQFLYTMGTFFGSSPIGRNIIKKEGIKNINCTEFVNGHNNYKPIFYKFLQMEETSNNIFQK